MPTASIRSASAIGATGVIAATLVGCAASPSLSPDQWDALETRAIDAPRERVLQTAASVMLDEGFAYSMSDHAAGLLAGFRLCSPTFSESYARGGGMRSCGHLVDSTMIWVRDDGPARSIARLQLRTSGVRVADEKRRAEIWAFIERRLVADGATPPPRVTAPPVPTATTARPEGSPWTPGTRRSAGDAR